MKCFVSTFALLLFVICSSTVFGAQADGYMDLVVSTDADSKALSVVALDSSGKEIQVCKTIAQPSDGSYYSCGTVVLNGSVAGDKPFAVRRYGSASASGKVV